MFIESEEVRKTTSDRHKLYEKRQRHCSFLETRNTSFDVFTMLNSEEKIESTVCMYV